MAKKKHQLKLVTLPAENLRQPSSKIKFPLPPDFPRLITEMVRVCRKHKGVGIAAPQVGINVKLIVINLEKEGLQAFPLFNPEIVKTSGEKIKAEEGCLSIPGKYYEIERPEKVEIKAQNHEGETVEFKAEGLLSRVLQHEIDHIEGKLFVDHLPEKIRKELTADFYQ